MKWQSTLFILGAIASQAFGDRIICDVDHDYADIGAIKDGIDYLNGLSGQPSQDAHSCGRVSCSYDAGIYMCSDDQESHTLASWQTLAKVSQQVLDQCSKEGGVKGRLLSDDGWGIAIQGAQC